MHFSHSNHGNHGKATKFVLVAGLHLVLGTLFIHSLNTRQFSLPRLPEQVVVLFEPDHVPPPPPVAPPQPPQQLAPPDLVVPKVEVEVAPPPLPQQIKAVVQTEVQPQPQPPSDTLPQAAKSLPPGTAHDGKPGQMHAAVFADANACALPDYPASAARQGETGTTTLALLVGADGRVSSARVEHSSGSRVLDRAALGALSLCKFKPAMDNGSPSAGWAQLAYVWTLD